METKWRIELLGGLRASRADVVIRRFPTQKAANLLAYLAIHSTRSHTREELIEMLWPGDDPALGRPRLRLLLHGLRALLDTPLPDGDSAFLASDQSTIQLNLDWTDTDVAEFERLASTSFSSPTDEQIANLQRAHELYRGELLPGFYEDWVAMERERLADLYASVLTRLANLWEQEGLLEKATAAYAKLAALDPLQEEHHLNLIRLYGVRGQTSHAITQYEKLEKILQEELTDEPSLATKTLIDKIRKRESQHGVVEIRSRELFGTSKELDAPPRPQLPMLSTRFFGREQEIAGALEIFHTPDQRLATLVGLGGCGKTRLAVEIGGRLAEDFDGAVWFVSLAEINAASQISLAILRSLNLTPPADSALSEAVAIALRRRNKALLILDNFEHLASVGGAEIVFDLLQAAPDLRVLVTSRQKLNIDGEQLVEVAPLPSPPKGCNETVLLGSPSIQLFVDRAQAANPSFRVSPDNIEAIRELCAKLEGIPLAIELAAASAAEMTPGQMLAGISHRFELLVSKRKDIPARHRSLRSAIEHGNQLLPKPVKNFFAKLSVFEGGWTLEAAQYVGESAKAGEYLKELADRSLVRVAQVNKGMRYEMLETIREYASQQLTKVERDALQARHVEYFVQMSNDAGRHGGVSDQAKWLAHLAADHENLMSAMKWCRETKNFATGLQMATFLGWYWEEVGPLSEGRECLEGFLELAKELPLELHASAFGTLGAIAWRQGDFPFAREYHERCLAMRRSAGDGAGVARALYGLGITFFRMGDLTQTRALIEESLAIATETGDPAGVARAVLNLGNVALEMGDFAGAKTCFERSVLLEKSLRNKVREISSLNNLGKLAYIQKRYVLAAHYNEECLRGANELGSKTLAAESLLNLGIVAGRQGQWGRAVNLIAESIRTSLAVGSGDYLVGCLCLSELARLAAEAGYVEIATSLLGGVDDAAEKYAARIIPSDKKDRRETEAAILSVFSVEQFEAALAAGRTMGLEQLLSYVNAWIESLRL